MDSTVTVSFVPTQIITWMVIGLVAGFLAGLVMRGRGYAGITGIALGLVGGLFGGILFTILNIRVGNEWYAGITIRYIDILVAFIGALLVLLLYRVTRRGRF